MLTRIVEHESLDSELAQAAFFSFLFSFRAPSETLCLIRAYSGDPPPDTFPPNPKEALMGVRVVEGVSLIFAKLSWGKNLTSGCILRRPCFCQLHAPRAKPLCPVRAFWPRVCRRVASGQPLCPSGHKRNVNRILKTALTKLAVPEAHRYSPHTRLGAAPRMSSGRQVLPGPRFLLQAIGAQLLSVAALICRGALNSAPNSCSRGTWTPCLRMNRYAFGILRKNPLAGRPGRLSLGAGFFLC